VVDNTVSDDAQVVTLHATAAGFTEGVGSLTVRDDESPAAPFNLVPGTRSENQPLQLTLSWQIESPLGDVLVNGDFESGDLGGWQVYSTVDLEDANFYINDGAFNPIGPEHPAPPYAGNFCAVGEQGGQSVISLYRSFTMPGCEGRVFLRWADRLRNDADRFSDHQRFWV